MIEVTTAVDMPLWGLLYMSGNKHSDESSRIYMD